MWIRSQDKKALVNCKNANYAEEDHGCKIIEVIGNSAVRLGTYSNEARAIAVIDEIQEDLTNTCSASEA